ncbi:glycosyltransferase [Fibrobacterota bacterium]
MRILVLGASRPLQTFLSRLFNGLADSGHQVMVGVKNPPSRLEEKKGNVRWVRVPEWSGPGWLKSVRCLLWVVGSYLKKPSVTRQVLRYAGEAVNPEKKYELLFRSLAVLRYRFDIVYFPWNTAAINYLPLMNIGIACVISCRGAQVNIAPHNPFRKHIREGLKNSFEKAAAVHCVSRHILDEAVKLGLEKAKAKVITPAVDPEFFCPPESRGRERERFVLISTGSLIWRKGFEFALMAVQILKKQGIPVVFRIIGEGPERQRILFTAADLDIEDSIVLLGSRRPVEIRDELQRADLYLLSSLSEGISNSALEAMACGLPVVSTDCGGMSEVIVSGVQGLLVPLQEPLSMAEAVAAVYHDPEGGRKMGEKARETILKDFTLKQQVRDFDLVLKSTG